MIFEVDGIVIEHRINRRLKHAYLSVEPDGTPVLKSNGKNLRALQAFVLSKREWIAKRRAQQHAKPSIALGEDILYLGTLIPVASALNIKQYDIPEARLRDAYHRQYKAWAEAYITEKTAHFASRMGSGYGIIRFRRMVRRWGSCSKAGDLTFNTMLMQLPPAFIDYTIVHELAHRKHFNHSDAFHGTVRDILPDERTLRKAMRTCAVCRY